MNARAAVALAVAPWALGASLALGLMTSPLAVTPHTAVSVTASPEEDDPGWSCATMGNRICGPDSDDWGHAPGCYSDTGTLVAPWPCYLVVDPNTGNADVYTRGPVLR